MDESRQGRNSVTHKMWSMGKDTVSGRARQRILMRELWQEVSGSWEGDRL